MISFSFVFYNFTIFLCTLPANSVSTLPIPRNKLNNFFSAVKELAEKEGVTEQLKAPDQMKWVQKMNDISNRAMEVVNSALIFV